MKSSLLIRPGCSRNSLTVRKSGIHNSQQLFWFIILHFCINVHSNFAVFVTRQILNRLRINTRMNEIRNIGVSQQMRTNIKVDTVYDLRTIGALLPCFWLKLLLDSLAVDISIDCSLLGTPNRDIPPYSLELRCGQRFPPCCSK